jgi:pantetheine-phosphate adenylyltransferase
MITGIYAGSFDPITNGHIDILKRSLSICDKLVIAIGVNHEKKTTMFSIDERLAMINYVLASGFTESLNNKNVSVVSFNGLIVNLAKELNAKVLIRGIRSVSDFEYEINLANVNKVLAPEIETVFLPTSPNLAVVSSSGAKTIARFEGDISSFVPPFIANEIKNKFGFIKFGDEEQD